MEKEIRLTAVAVNNDKIQLVRQLYERYAGMLLGYISEVVKNKDKAEACLAEIFYELPTRLEEMERSHLSEFCFLQALTREKMSIHAGKEDKEPAALKLNKYFNLLDDEHRRVFYSLHYQCKKAAVVATELNKSEQEIRALLKEAFTIIRKGERA